MNPIKALDVVTTELDRATKETADIIVDQFNIGNEYILKPIAKSIGSLADKITNSECTFGISGGISLLTGTPDVTIGWNCSDKKDKS